MIAHSRRSDCHFVKVDDLIGAVDVVFIAAVVIFALLSGVRFTIVYVLINRFHGRLVVADSAALFGVSVSASHRRQASAALHLVVSCQEGVKQLSTLNVGSFQHRAAILTLQEIFKVRLRVVKFKVQVFILRQFWTFLSLGCSLIFVVVHCALAVKVAKLPKLFVFVLLVDLVLNTVFLDVVIGWRVVLNLA